MKVKILAPAKINLYLKVLGKRPDGYHEIESLVVPVSLCDLVEVERTEKGIEVFCDSPDCPSGERNIAYRAAEWFFEISKASGGARIFIRKRIPVGAGLGGGSSDAASVIKALGLLYKFKLDLQDRTRLGFEVGADVPMFFVEGAKIIRGIGELVEPIKYDGPRWFALVNPRFQVSTAEIYSRLSLPLTRNNLKNKINIKELLWKNDLQDVVSQLDVRVYELIKDIEGLGFKVCVSGSGPTCVAPLDSPNQADKILKVAIQRDCRVYIVHNV